MFYEIAIKVNRMQENGKEKEVVERYIADAETFTEAEAKGVKEYADYQLKGDVVAIKRSNVYEIVNENNGEYDKLFKAKIVSIFVDEKTEKEKEQPYHVLIWATDMDDANRKVQEYMKQGLSDMRWVLTKETNLIDVI